MRKLALVLFVVASLFAAGTINRDADMRAGETIVLSYTWIGDASTGAVPDINVTLDSNRTSLVGTTVLRVQTDPGTPAPTDNYDVYLTDSHGEDVLENLCADRDTANTESCAPARAYPLHSTLTLKVRNSSQASATGVIRIFLTRRMTAWSAVPFVPPGTNGARRLDFPHKHVEAWAMDEPENVPLEFKHPSFAMPLFVFWPPRRIRVPRPTIRNA